MANNHSSSTNMKKQRVKYREECREVDAVCWLCGQAIDYEAAQTDYDNLSRFQLDHFYPVSTHPWFREDPACFRPSHAGCNQDRSNKKPEGGLGTLSEEWF